MVATICICRKPRVGIFCFRHCKNLALQFCINKNSFPSQNNGLFSGVDKRPLIEKQPFHTDVRTYEESDSRLKLLHISYIRAFLPITKYMSVWIPPCDAARANCQSCVSFRGKEFHIIYEHMLQTTYPFILQKQHLE